MDWYSKNLADNHACEKTETDRSKNGHICWLIIGNVYVCLLQVDKQLDEPETIALHTNLIQALLV